MSWDFKIDRATNDLVPGYVNGHDEVLQRAITRLRRELGEWFLDVEAGLKWYNAGFGMLGTSVNNAGSIEAAIRNCLVNTEGIAMVGAIRFAMDRAKRSAYVLAAVRLASGQEQNLVVNVTA